MPTYDMTCEKCGSRFDRFVARMLREDDKVCPDCGSARVKVGFGGGFVVNRADAERCAPRGGFA